MKSTKEIYIELQVQLSLRCMAKKQYELAELHMQNVKEILQKDKSGGMEC